MGVNSYVRPLAARSAAWAFEYLSLNSEDYEKLQVYEDIVDSTSITSATKSYVDMITGETVVMSGVVQPILALGLYGILINDQKDGENGAFATAGRFVLPVHAADNPAQGQILYWDQTNYRLTVTAGALKKMGRAVTPKFATAASAKMVDMPAATGNWVIIQLNQELA